MIFYYTSTGNSLYVAKQLGDEKLISIPQALKEDNLIYEDEVIGIVCPDYAAELPQSVRRFLEKATLKAKYMYVLITYGALDSIVADWTYNFASQNGIHLDYVNTILMVDNWLPSFDMLSEMEIDKHIPEQIVTIKENLQNRKQFVKGYTEEGKAAWEHVRLRNKENPEWINGSALHCDTSKCTGCGVCTKVCPVGRNILKDGKRAEMRNTCDFCLGCIHACPKNAFYLTINDKNTEARYRNPNIKIKDIMEANHQN